MKYVSIAFLMIFVSMSAWSAKPISNCAKGIEIKIAEVKEWPKYGIANDGGRVQFPKKCTPLMEEKKMIPLPKRHAGATNRERYLGNDCHIYEWDYQHGVFEVYAPNHNKHHYVHLGEKSAITKEENFSKRKADRDHDAGDTGIPGYDMKKLCKEHSHGNLEISRFEKLSKNKTSLKCL